MKRRKPINYAAMGPIDATFAPKAPEGWTDPFYESPPTGVIVEGDFGTSIERVSKRDGEWWNEAGYVVSRPRYWRLPEGETDA